MPQILTICLFTENVCYPLGHTELLIVIISAQQDSKSFLSKKSVFLINVLLADGIKL